MHSNNRRIVVITVFAILGFVCIGYFGWAHFFTSALPSGGQSKGINTELLFGLSIGDLAAVAGAVFSFIQVAIQLVQMRK